MISPENFLQLFIYIIQSFHCDKFLNVPYLLQIHTIEIDFTVATNSIENWVNVGIKPVKLLGG